MKRIISLAIICILIGMLIACGEHHHTYNEADCENAAVCSECGETIKEALGHTTTVGACSRCGEVQNEELVGILNTDFAEIMDVGTQLMDCVSGVADLPSETQYERYLSADAYTDQMKELYTDIIEACSENNELEEVVYQTQLLENQCPSPVAGSDATSLANQAVLYQMYLQQISSSFSYLSEYMDYLAGNREMPDGITYYDELSNMPTPDSVIYGIAYSSEKTDSGVKQYFYTIGDNSSDANMNLNIYLAAVDHMEGLTVEITDTYSYVTKAGKMVSAIMAGTDSSLGYFMIVSFQE